MDTEQHLGYTNYATAVVAMDVDNERGSFYHSRNLVMELSEAGRDDGQIAEALKDYYESAMPEDAVDGMWGTFMRIGFGEVDWLDLARTWLADARELVSQGDDLR